MNFIDLDECVIDALDLFAETELKEFTPAYKKPLITGSGNAAVTGRIMFQGTDAVFADESNYKSYINAVDGGVVISASGKKHAPPIAKSLSEHGKHVTLLTTNPDAPAAEYADEVIVSPRNTEPYTYNTSTYMGMILSKSKEDPSKIKGFILNEVKPLIPKDLDKYKELFLLVPEEFDTTRQLFMTKFDELFGPKMNGRVFTPEQAKHAKTVIPSDTELFISIGYDNNLFGEHRLNIPLPDDAGPAAVMAIGYYVIGHVQKQHPPYFKKNIRKYTKWVSDVFGQEIEPMQ